MRYLAMGQWLKENGRSIYATRGGPIKPQKWGVTTLPQGRNWLQLPDGLAVELIQAAPGSVAQALAVNPRAR